MGKQKIQTFFAGSTNIKSTVKSTKKSTIKSAIKLTVKIPQINPGVIWVRKRFCMVLFLGRKRGQGTYLLIISSVSCKVSLSVVEGSRAYLRGNLSGKFYGY